jgi:hypothetical protein
VQVFEQLRAAVILQHQVEALEGMQARPRTDGLGREPAIRERIYSGHPDIADGTLRLCEFAVLNKANTHETRVHHVETPERILTGDSDVGPVWVSELKFAQDSGDAVSGSTMPDAVNVPVVYSVAFLATQSNKHRKLAEEFVDFLLGDAAQIYVDGGFLPLVGDELAERYSLAKDGTLVIETFTP